MFTALATVALSATAAYSQSVPPMASSMSASAPVPITTGSPEGVAQQGLATLSAECRSAIISLAVSPLTQCLSINTLLPAISADANVVPILDDWMTQICASEPCEQDFLDSAASNFSSACASDLESYNVDASDVEGIFGLYPLVRELVCLKTTEPFEANSTMTSNSTTAENTTSTSISTEESTFCVTSVLEELSSYLGTNLTVNGIFGLVLGSDTEGRQALTEIPPSALCQDCVYSAAGLIEQQYPGIWLQPLVNGKFNVSGYLNETCSNETFPVIDEETNTITLPESVYPSVENSTYPYGINYTNGTTNGSYTPSEDVQQPPALPFANVAAAPINGTSTPVESSSASSSASVTSSASSGPAMSSAAAVTSVASSAVSSAQAIPSAVTASAGSIVSDVAASFTAGLPPATSAAAAKRDVTAAKRRWVGQQ